MNVFKICSVNLFAICTKLFRISPISESGNGLLSLLNLLLGLDSTVKDGTVTTLAEDLLVKGTLAALALHPQVAVVLLVQLQLLLPLDINLFHSIVAVAAHDFLIAAEQIFATQARLLHFGEFKQAHVGVAHRWLENISRVVTREQYSLSTVT